MEIIARMEKVKSVSRALVLTIPQMSSNLERHTNSFRVISDRESEPGPSTPHWQNRHEASIGFFGARLEDKLNFRFEFLPWSAGRNGSARELASTI